MPARLETLFLLFFTYAVAGWCMEVTCKLFQFHRFINRGFLIGPYCPIYGVGAVAISLLLDRYVSDPPVLFCMSMIICSILEYFTSWAMEKLFHARWWDYSQRRFNLNGRICLNTMVPFGLLGMLMMYAVNPALLGLIQRLGDAARHALSGILAAGFLTDLGVSTAVLTHVRHDNRVLDRDNTEEMAAKVREAITARGWAHRRLLDAYPQVRHIGHVIRENVAELRDTVAENAADARERLAESAAGARERLTESAAEARDRLTESAATARDRLAESAAGARDALTESAATARDRLAAGSAAWLEAELRRLEDSHDRAEAEYRRRRSELQEKLDGLRDRD